MPVINLPRDERWGDLGKGLGGLIEKVSQGLLEKRASEGVAQIMQDTSIAEDQKPIRALKDFGDLGYKKYQEMLKSQLTASQIKNTAAEAWLTQTAAKLKEKALPLEQRRIEAGIGKTEQDTVESKALTPARVGLMGAQADSAVAGAAQTREQTITEQQARDPRIAAIAGTVTERMENTDEQRLKNAALRAQLGETGVAAPPMVGRSGEIAPPEEQPATLTAPGTARKVPDQLGTMLDPYNLTTSERKGAEAQYIANERKKPGSGLDAAIDYAAKREAAKERIANQPAVPEGTAKLARANASYGVVSERFLNELVKETTEVGLLNATGVKARLARAGLPVADESLSTMLEAQKQLVASQAKEGAVFMSGQTIRLGKDISPSLDRTKLSNVLGMGLTAEKNLAELDIEKQRYAGNPRAEAMIDKAGEQWRRVLAVTGSVQSHIAKDERGKERTVMYFMGNQVDPFTLKPRVKQDNTQYEVRGKKLTGVDLFNIGRQLGKDPWQVLQEMK